MKNLHLWVAAAMWIVAIAMIVIVVIDDTAYDQLPGTAIILMMSSIIPGGAKSTQVRGDADE